MQEVYFFISLVAVISLLTGCAGYPSLLSFPFDRGGRTLNSAASELTPYLASRYLVFASDRNGSQAIYLFDAIDRRLLPLPGLNSLDQIASSPSISEDGRYIVFTASRQGKTAIYLYDRQTQQRREIAPDLLAEVRNPIISADGSKVAFEAAKNGQWDIMIYDLSGRVLINENQ
jgi:Tol biopolymer transport system component